MNTAEMTRACRGVVTVQDCGEGSQEEHVGHLQSAGGPGTKAAGRGLSQRGQVLFRLKYVHDGVVQLREHHKVDGKAGGAVLGGRVAREPGQSVVLLQDEPAERAHGQGHGQSHPSSPSTRQQEEASLSLTPGFLVVPRPAPTSPRPAPSSTAATATSGFRYAVHGTQVPDFKESVFYKGV